MVVVQILGLPTDWFLGASALVGTAIGFGSTQTIGNFLAGLYILITRPFTVRDFVRIGDVEGQVEEITINYTMVYVETRNLVKIPNTQILNSKITHFTKEGVIDYSFILYFDHSLTNERMTNNVLEPAIEEFYKKYEAQILDRPRHYLVDADQGRKTFSIRVFFKKGDAKSLYNLKPDLLRMILDRYYDEKARE
jgi:small-conductance mechanosensitive channel